MKNETATIIILTPGFATDEMDSTCLPAQQTFTKALKENFPAVNIIVLSFHYPFFRESYQWHGVDVISLNGRNRGKLFKVLLWRKAMRQLKNIYRENNVIGLLSFWHGECAWIGKRFSRKYGLKHFCWILGQDAKKGNRFVRKTHPLPDELIALSDSLQAEFEKNYSVRPAHVIPPGIDIRQFPEKKLVRDIDVLAAGWLTPLKQFGIFLSTVYEIKKHFPGVRAVLCGRGPEEGRCCN
jgi:glycosyltransferase involved in cell wall biosynthesis